MQPKVNDAEMSRRYQLLEDSRGKTLERPAFDDYPIVEAQRDKVMLWAVAHEGRSPQPRDVKEPAFIMFGCFDGQAEALAHSEVLKRKWCDIDFLTTPLGNWWMMHTDRNKRPEDTQARVEARVDEHIKTREKNFEQLKASQAKRLQSRTGYHKSERAKRREGEATQHEAQTGQAPAGRTREGAENDQLQGSATQREGLTGVPPFLRRYALHGQEVALISVLPDVSRLVRRGKKLPEPIVRFYGCFSSKKHAIKWSKERLGPHVGDFDIDTVDMYGWLFPQNLDVNELEEEFRDPEINNILRAQKQEKQNTTAFRQQCASTGMEPDMEYISGKPALGA